MRYAGFVRSEAVRVMSENEAAEQDARATLEALMELHPSAQERRELIEASVALSRINALYPLDANFFIACIDAYLQAGRPFALLAGDLENKAENLEYVAWGSYRPRADSLVLDEMLRWWARVDDEARAELLPRMRAAAPELRMKNKQYHDTCANTLWLLGRLFWYMTHIESSLNPYRVHRATALIYPMVLTDFEVLTKAGQQA